MKTGCTHPVNRAEFLAFDSSEQSERILNALVRRTKVKHLFIFIRIPRHPKSSRIGSFSTKGVRCEMRQSQTFVHLIRLLLAYCALEFCARSLLKSVRNKDFRRLPTSAFHLSAA